MTRILRPDSGKFFKFFVLAGIFFYGCSANKFIVNQVAGAMNTGRAAFEREPDLEIAQTALASNLKLLEAILEEDPTNENLRLFLSEGYALYSMAFVEDKYEELGYANSQSSDYERKRAIRFYLRSRDYASARICKKLNIASAEQIVREKLEKYLAGTKREDVRELFWFAFSWGSAINLQRDDIAELASLPFIVMIMTRVRELDENYYFGGAFLFEGMYFGGRPPMLGGDFGKSARSFEKAMAVTGKKLLLVPYFYARTYCIQKQDFKCFKDNLHYVINAPDNIFPEQMLANALAKKKAERLYLHASDYFIESEK